LAACHEPMLYDNTRIAVKETAAFNLWRIPKFQEAAC
jgi:hypothetical protein